MTLERVFKVLWARRAVLVLSVFTCVGLVAIASILAPKKYVAELTLVVDFKGSDPLADTALSSPLLSSYIATQREIISSRNVALKVIDALGLAEGTAPSDAQSLVDPRTAYIGQVLKPLETASSLNSNLIRVSYRSDNPYTAAQFANAIGAAYVQTSLELQVDPARRQAAWFEQQVQKLREDLAQSQNKLDAYQRDHGVLGVDAGRLDVENSRLQEISSQLVKAQAAFVEAETRAGGSREIPDLLTNPLLQGLKSELARAEAKLADLAERVDRNHPQYKSAAAEVSALRSKLEAEIDVARASLAQSASMAGKQVRELETALKQQKERIIALNEQRDDLSVLQRDVESARAAYDAALQQANKSRLESRIDRTNIAILNPAAVPSSPASPRILLNIALALVVSSLLVAAWVLYGEFVRPRVRSNEDLLEFVDLPVLAELPAPPRRSRPRTREAPQPALPLQQLRPRAT